MCCWLKASRHRTRLTLPPDMLPIQSTAPRKSTANATRVAAQAPNRVMITA